MSDEPDETTYYLRLLSMYIDLGTEIVLNVFIHHSPNKDAEHFLKSNHTLLTNLSQKRILNKEEYNKATEKPPNLKRFDISLLITLSINLFTKEQLPQPAQGWNQPPKNKDKSIGADLLRLRQIRNAIVGHHHAARLPKLRFDEKWEKVSDILLRIQRQIAQENDGEPELLAKIETYRLQSLDASIRNKHDPILKDWYNEMSEIQEKAEKLIKRVTGFDDYFKNKCDRYERYIALLQKGGQFVLSAVLENELKKQKKELRSILDENKVSLSSSLNDPKQIDILYPTESDSSLQSLDVSSWNVPLLAVVILNLFKETMGRACTKAVETIKNAYTNYMDTALIALDSNTFEDYSTTLKAKLEVLSDLLDDNQATLYNEIIENCKKKIAEEEFKTFMDELKSQGSQMKTFQDIYLETIRDTKGVLQEMITHGISFKNDRDLELKMITLGTDEEKKVVAEQILVGVWHEALNRSLASSDFPEVKKQVMIIIAEINKSKSVKDIGIQTHCILLQITCSSPKDMLNLINYFESDTFRDTLHNLSSELGYYFNTALAICAVLPIDSLWKMINLDDTADRRGICIPIKVSSPAGMLELRSLFQSEKIANSTNSIADALSMHLGEQIDLNVFTDMKELEGAFDEGNVSSESCTDSSSAENDAEDACNSDQPAVQRTEQDNDGREIIYCISPDDCNIEPTNKDTEVSSDLTKAVMTTETETCIGHTKMGLIPISFSASSSDSVFKDKPTLRDSQTEDSDESDTSIAHLTQRMYERLGRVLDKNAPDDQYETVRDLLIIDGDLDVSRREQRQIAMMEMPGVALLVLLNERGHTLNDLQLLFEQLNLQEPLDILREIQIKNKSERRGMRIPIKVSSPAGMLKLGSLFQSEDIANSTNSIAGALSRHLGKQIDLNVLTDMKEQEGVFDEGNVSSESCTDRSSAENDTEDACNSDQPAVQRTEQDNDGQGITYRISSDDCNIELTKYTEVSSDLTKAVIASETETCIEHNKMDSVPMSSSAFATDAPVVSGFKSKPTITDSRTACTEDSENDTSISHLKQSVCERLGWALDRNAPDDEYETVCDLLIIDGDLDVSRQEQRQITAMKGRAGVALLNLLDDRGYTLKDLQLRFEHLNLQEPLYILREIQNKVTNRHSIEMYQRMKNICSPKNRTAGPGLDLETFFSNPAYHQGCIEDITMAPRKTLGRYVSETMDRLGYSYDLIKYRQQCFKEVSYTHDSYIFEEIVITGDKCEGTALFIENDFDRMYILRNIICADYPKAFYHHGDITLFQTERHESSPGYTRLKLLKFDGKSSVEYLRQFLSVSETGEYYLSSQSFIGVISLRCVCPDILKRWVSRLRCHGWPSQATINKIFCLDAHVVPVGFKGSKNMSTEWRICYPLAELHLMQTLNETQIKVYILLKQICKSVLNPVCKDMTSYIMKNIVLWMCEANGIERCIPDTLMDRFFDCIVFLRSCINENNLSCYMIPERNLLADRLDIQQRKQLFILLSDLLHERGRMLLRCNKLREAMLVMYKIPDIFRDFSEERDKAEMILLRISDEQFKQKFCDIASHFYHLKHFDVQALRQMAKTESEINDLLASHLVQLLS